jgi:uncharacterized protein YecE (DUF72 family)
MQFLSSAQGERLLSHFTPRIDLDDANESSKALRGKRPGVLEWFRGREGAATTLPLGPWETPLADAGAVRIGISGWQYTPWRGVFYPAKLPQKGELHYASSIFRTIEINGTFYSLQRPESFSRWASEPLDGFIFTVKAPRFITHIRRLKEVNAPLANFLASGVLRLGPKLGPILWQFPPNFKFDAARMESFLRILPHTTEAAAALARRHDKWMNGRSSMKVDQNRALRHAMEIRNTSFVNPDFIAMLRQYDVALVCADTVEWPRLMDVTSDFIYCRLHGSEALYASGYDDAALDEWASRLAAWARGNEPDDAELAVNQRGAKLSARDVFAFFDNDVKVRAPFDAQKLMARVDRLLEP